MLNEFVRVAFVHEIPSGTGRTVDINGIWIALFNVDGTFYAMDNSCPHAGGPLGEGQLCGAVVECPWHGWKFNVKLENELAIHTSRLPVVKFESKGTKFRLPSLQRSENQREDAAKPSASFKA
jgi:nitrite reductase/ring-hydroxylating ferredoxin subunit